MRSNFAEEKALFDKNGFVGPLKLWEPNEMRAWWRTQRRALLDPANNERAAFPGNPINYDRHLDIPGLSRIVSERAIVCGLQHLIGPDILCWRTEFFPKNPGDAGTGWHQVETYAIGETSEGMLTPTERVDEVPIELTIWIALTEATKENGCLKFLPGSHRTWYYDELGYMEHSNKEDSKNDSNHTFFGYNYDELKLSPDWKLNESEAVHMEMEPGEFVIFTARCVHGSLPNTSRKQRMGFAIRVVPTHVKVYAGMTEFCEFGQQFDLARHGCVLIAGGDTYGYNRIKTENAWGEPFTTLPRSIDETLAGGF